MKSKLINLLFGKQDDGAQVASIRFHYERHFYGADKFKEVMRDLHSVALPEVVNEHEAVIGGAYFCTREQLLAANDHRHSDWGPFPESIHCATFVVQPDCSLRVHFEQLYPVAAMPPVPPEDFSATILGKTSLEVLANDRNHSLASLLSAARSEYLNTRGIAGYFMTKLTGLFGEIADQAYGGRFVWSDYNMSQWKKFVACGAASSEGGSCVFSCEEDGGYSDKIHATFKGLFVGVPTGMYPYSISVRHGIAKIDSDAIRSWLSDCGYANA